MQKVRLEYLFRICIHTCLAEKTLQTLMKQRRTTVEEIKKKTNFDSIVKLFQEYDEPSTSTTPLRRRLPQGQTPVTPHPPGRVPISQPQTPVPSALQAQLTRK